MARKNKRIPPAGNRGGKSIPDPLPPTKESSVNKKAVLSFELFDSTHECPSDWGNDIKSLFDAFKKVSCRTWIQIFQSGGKSGTKTGLGFTKISPAPFKLPREMSKDMEISEIRVSEKKRFFGTLKNEVYYVIRLDRNHRVCK